MSVKANEHCWISRFSGIFVHHSMVRVFDGVVFNYANLRLVCWCLQRQIVSEAGEHLHQNNIWSYILQSSPNWWQLSHVAQTWCKVWGCVELLLLTTFGMLLSDRTPCICFPSLSGHCWKQHKKEILGMCIWPIILIYKETLSHCLNELGGDSQMGFHMSINKREADGKGDEQISLKPLI